MKQRRGKGSDSKARKQERDREGRRSETEGACKETRNMTGR